VDPLERTSQFWNIGVGLEGDLPFQPWARELRAERVARNSADNPDAHCLPIGITQLHNHPQPRKIIQTPTLIVILYEANGGVRQIFLDGRPLPDNDPQPWWYGYSVGRWDGDTLVVETTGLRDGGWLDVNGSPLTDEAKVTERFRRRQLRSARDRRHGRRPEGVHTAVDGADHPPAAPPGRRADRVRLPGEREVHAALRALMPRAGSRWRGPVASV
jgi:hypothetical protein